MINILGSFHLAHILSEGSAYFLYLGACAEPTEAQRKGRADRRRVANGTKSETRSAAGAGSLDAARSRPPFGLVEGEYLPAHSDTSQCNLMLERVLAHLAVVPSMFGCITRNLLCCERGVQICSIGLAG